MSDGYYVDRFGKGNYLALKFEDIDPDVTSLLVGLQGEQTEFDFNSDEYYVLKVEDVTKPLVITATKADNTTITKSFDLSELTCMIISVVSPQTYENPDSYDGDPCDAYFADIIDFGGTIKLNNNLYSLEIVAVDNNGNEPDVNWNNSPIGSNKYNIALGVDINTEWVDLTITIKYTDSNVYGDAEYTVGVRFKKS